MMQFVDLAGSLRRGSVVSPPSLGENPECDGHLTEDILPFLWVTTFLVFEE